jgi:protein-tyrosine phosphatase
MEDNKKYKVLFVCLGNICRSPSAEAVFRHKIEEMGLDNRIEIDSAGLLSFHEGEKADSRMRHHANRRGISLTSRSRPIVDSDFQEFDLIIGMDNSNMDELEKMAEQYGEEIVEKLYKMTDFSIELDYDVVPDPYYGGEEGFELVLDLLDDACNGLIKYIRAQIGV